MKELFGGLQNSLAGYVQAWLLSAVLAVGTWSFLVFPIAVEKDSAPKPFASIEELDQTSQVFVGAFVALVASLLFAAFATPAYRRLEGYFWPSRPRDWLVERHGDKREALQKRPEGETRIERAERAANLDMYPRNVENLMPTKLGNVLRASETYGGATYGIDTVRWWHQLMSVTEEPLRQNLDRTRAAMDFAMGLFLSAPVFALASLWVALASGDGSALWGVLVLLALPFAYAGVVSGAIAYGAAIRAVADVSRLKLAEVLGLTIPSALADEREMWSSYNQYTAWGGHGFPNEGQWEEQIDLRRVSPDPVQSGTNSRT